MHISGLLHYFYLTIPHTVVTETTDSPTTAPAAILTGSGVAQIAGENYTLTCQLTGEGTTTPIYQWFRNGSLLTDQTSDTLSFSPLSETDSGVYTCEGTRSSITVTSGAMTITVMCMLTYGGLAMINLPILLNNRRKKGFCVAIITNCCDVCMYYSQIQHCQQL